MEPTQPQQQRTPGQPMRPRPVMNDFVPRRPSMDGFTSPRPATPRPVQPTTAIQPTLAPTPSTTPVASPVPPRQPMPVVETQPTAAPTETFPEYEAPRQTENDVHESKAPRPKSTTKHAGIVGLAVFILLTAILLSPFLPGKILNNFPGSSASESNGEQSLACINELQNVQTSQKYDTKFGAPIVYSYSASTTQTGICDGRSQSATVGHDSQFNPLGLAIDFFLAVVVASIVSKIWKRLFGEKHHY